MSSRMSLRRRILYLLLVTGFLFLIVNIHQKAIWAHTFHSDVEMMPGADVGAGIGAAILTTRSKQQSFNRNLRKHNDLYNRAEDRLNAQGNLGPSRNEKLDNEEPAPEPELESAGSDQVSLNS